MVLILATCDFVTLFALTLDFEVSNGSYIGIITYWNILSMTVF